MLRDFATAPKLVTWLFDVGHRSIGRRRITRRSGSNSRFLPVGRVVCLSDRILRNQKGARVEFPVDSPSVERTAVEATHLHIFFRHFWPFGVDCCDEKCPTDASD